jgi:hypothetical protein
MLIAFVALVIILLLDGLATPKAAMGSFTVNYFVEIAICLLILFMYNNKRLAVDTTGESSLKDHSKQTSNSRFQSQSTGRESLELPKI